MRRTNFYPNICFTIVIFVLLFTCGKESTGPDGDQPGIPVPSELAGTWTATSAEFTSQASPVQRQNILQQGGSVSLVIEGNGGYLLTISEDGVPPVSENGFISRIDNIDITFTPVNGTVYDQAYTYNITTLQLVNATAQYDFDHDGTMEAATCSITFRRVEPDIANLVGTWTATRYQFTNTADTSQKVEIISLGGSLTLSITPQRAYSATTVFPGQAPLTENGTIINKTVNSILLQPYGDDTYVVSYTLSGNLLTVVDHSGDYDFNGDGMATAATGLMELRKN